MGLTDQEEKNLVTRLQEDPALFAEMFLDAKLWRKQKQIARAVAQHSRVSVTSGHALGKSFLAAGLSNWFLYSFPKSKVVTTATTFSQVKSVVWSEIRTLHKRLAGKFEPLGEVFQTEIRIDTDHWAMGISPDRPDALQGRHAGEMGNILIIVDEAVGISYDMFFALEAIAIGSNAHMLLIGNPTNPLSYQGDIAAGKIPGWKRMSMSCYESPNIYIGEDGQYHNYDPLPYPGLVDLNWIEEKKKQWGVNSPQYVSRVLGRFPELAEDQLIANRYIAQSLQKGLVLRKIVRELEEGSRIVSSADLNKLLSQTA